MTAARESLLVGKAEYNHLDFGTRTENLQPINATAAFQYDIRQTIDLVKVGLTAASARAGRWLPSIDGVLTKY